MSELNDPRVFFAAERTLLAWNRTSLALIAFGFLVERSALLLRLLRPDAVSAFEHQAQLWAGVAFLLLGAWTALWSSLQYRWVVKTLKPIEIPKGYSVSSGPFANFVVALLGLLLAGYLFLL